jgi:lipopolysaccharide transport system ATP-binding protein
MKPIIHIEGLGKQYRVGTQRKAYRTVRESLSDFFRSPWRRLQSGSGEELLWVLKDISFDVYPGEVVGIIGRNGAGKSTLLKIISRITEPSRGRIELYGRVGCLLEVGTGFHPELTGRENIYLNGAILGMKKAEIERRFDEIVAFAEIETFLHTPVKHYSSGMYMKLAFAVAAHLSPEVLLVDEVLAVGDSSFQKKCLGKMRDVARSGRTVLFVSHNSGAIEALCDRCIWLKNGFLQAQGEPAALLREYLTADATPEHASVSLADHKGRRGGSHRIMQRLTLLSDKRTPVRVIRVGESIGVQVTFNSDQALKPILGVVVRTITGSNLFGINNRVVPAIEVPSSVREGLITCWIENSPLMPGTYFIDLYFGSEYGDLDVIQEAVSFDVEVADIFGTGQLAPASAGPICWPARYEFSACAEPFLARQQIKIGMSGE